MQHAGLCQAFRTRFEFSLRTAMTQGSQPSMKASDRHSRMLSAGIQIFSNPWTPAYAGVTVGVIFWKCDKGLNKQHGG
jgi:hypothetical protein